MRKAEVEVRISFADLDGMKAVYHSNYLKWFDLARTELYREAGFPTGDWGAEGILLPLVVCHCEFMSRAGFDDLLKVTAEVEEVKRKTITLKYEVVDHNTGMPVCTGYSKQIVCDQDHKSFILEECYPELYQALIG